MSKYLYFGYNVGLIYELYYVYTDYQNLTSGGTNKETDKCIKDHPTRYLLATTADYFQSEAHKVLLDNGFRKVVQFKSAHQNPKEKITLWFKKDRGAKLFTDKNAPAIAHNGYMQLSCSVTFRLPISDSNNIPCHVVFQNPMDKKYRKIIGANIWFKINPRFEIAVK